MLPEQLKQLMEAYRQGAISDAELAELKKALHPDQADEWYSADMKLVFYNAQDRLSNDADQQIRLAISALAEQESSKRVVHRIHFLKTAWFRYAAAILLIVGVGAYLWNLQQKPAPPLTQTHPSNNFHDIAPGRDRAVLTLSDGRKLSLTADLTTIEDADIRIRNKNGRLEYRDANKVVFNTMTTPRGGQYKLALPDGTMVWLNAASSITYPTAFVNGVREVTITGEAYFEVKANPSKPFLVKTSKEIITVLGTEFNVNAYENETVFKTSLVSGSIKINNSVLRPGQAYKNGTLITTNLGQDLAWKNGVFDFDRIKLSEAMRQLERWYDIEVEFSGNVEDIELRGQIGRDLSLQQIINGLQDKNLRFTLNDRVLNVSK